MPDTEGFNAIVNGNGTIVGVLAFQSGVIPSGPGVGNPIFAAEMVPRVKSAAIDDTNPMPSSDAITHNVLATVAANTNGAATAALQTSGNALLNTVAAAQGAAGTGLAQPAGGTGILGFLSGIYARLGTALTVSGSVTTNDGGTGATGVAQPTGGAGLSGWLSGIYNVLANLGVLTKPAPFVNVPPDIVITGAANTAQNIFNAGNVAAGGYFIPSVAGVVNQNGAAVIAATGASIPAAGGVPFDLAPSANPVSFISNTASVAIGGLGLK